MGLIANQMDADPAAAGDARKRLVPLVALLLALLTFGFGHGIQRLRFFDQGFIGDSDDYYLFAGNLCYEGVFSGDREPPPRPSAFRPPLLPVTLSAVMRAFGHDDFLAKARVLQLILAACGVCVLFALTRLVFDLHVAILAGVFQALYFPLVFSTTQLTTEPLAVLLLLSSLLAFWLWLRGGGPRLLAMSAALLGFGALTRPNLLFVVPVLVLVVLVRGGDRPTPCRGLSAGLLVVSCLVPIVPWTVRNAVSLGGFSLISTNGGMNFYLGHAPDFDPSLGADRTDYGIYRRLRDEGLDEIEADRQLYRLGVAHMLEDPVREMKRSWGKLGALMTDYARFLRPWRLWGLAIVIYLLVRVRRWQLAAVTGVALAVFLALATRSAERPGDLLMVFATSWTLLWPLALVGVGLSRRRRDVVVLLGLVWLAVLSAGILYIPLARIRWTVDFIAVMFAAAGLHALGSRLAALRGSSNVQPPV